MYKIIIDLEAYNLRNKKPPGATVKSCPPRQEDRAPGGNERQAKYIIVNSIMSLKI